MPLPEASNPYSSVAHFAPAYGGCCWQAMHALSERILRANSATLELERWCQAHAIGDGRLVAIRAPDAIPQALDADSLEALHCYGARGPSVFRRVQLATAGIVLVDALNWYFPAQLSLQMRETLETTDIPFGRVIAALRPRRRTFFVRRNTPEQLMEAQRHRDGSAVAFAHRAVVHTDAGAPIAIVHEQFRLALTLAVVSPAPVARRTRLSTDIEDALR